MTVYVHLVEGDSATDRLERVTQLVRASRRPVMVFAETSDPPCTPLDWLMGPGCTCCLSAHHPRLRLIHAAGVSNPVRVIIDAGPQAMASCIAGILGALPIAVCWNIHAH